MGNPFQHQTQCQVEDVLQISSSYYEGQSPLFLFFVLIPIWHQNGMDYSKNPVFYSTLLDVCASMGLADDKDGIIELDHECKRVHIQAVAYTGTNVGIIIIISTM